MNSKHVTFLPGPGIRPTNSVSSGKRSSQDNSQHREVTRRIEKCKVSGEQRIDLTDLTLSEIPSNIAVLQNITSLCIYKNKLSTLPPEICKLSSLVAILASENSFTTLPDEMKQLKKLEIEVAS